MAKRLCGTADRLYQAGLLGLCSCVWRAASSPPARIVSEILQRSSHPLGAEQGCTGSASSPSCWQHNCQAAPRRITPSIRSNLICGRDKGASSLCTQSQVEKPADLSNEMICRHHLV